MHTDITEINDGIYRLSTFVPEVGPTGFAFNQFLVDADEPLLFHTGARGMYPLVSAAVASVIPVERLRWISFGHVESDECGAMNQFLAAAPESQVVFNATGVLVSLNDLADRPPRILSDGEVLDIGGKRIRMVETPHVPHGWESQVLFEETTSTLFTGDLFTALGNPPAITTDDIVEAAMEGEALFHASSLAPSMTQVLERLADLQPTTLALMHGSTFKGDGAAQLRGLAQAYDERYFATV